MSILFLAGLISVAGCPGTLDNKEQFLATGSSTATSSSTGSDPGPCGDVPQLILAPSCGGSGCHGVKAPQSGLDLESPGLAARVVGVSAMGCQGLLADPANPAASVLYTKLLSTVACGAQMPLGRAELAQSKIDCIESWIAAQGSGTTTGSGAGGSGAGGAGGAGASTSASTGP